MIAKFSIFLSLIVVICNCQVSKPSNLQDSLTPRLLSNNYVTKEGIITLQKDSLGFFVYVDLQNQYSEASDSEDYDPSLATMSLGLYTSQTVLVQSCLNFNEYYCSNYGCYAYTWWQSNFNLPYFSVTGYYAQSQMFLDYGNWELNSYATIATSCSEDTYSPYGTSRSGILGLGLNTSSSSNFIGYSTAFSLSLSRDASSGTLMFSENTNITSSASYIGSLTTDSQWQIFPSSLLIEGGSSSISFTGGVIFDLDADCIGFPSYIFSQVLSLLTDSVSTLSCVTNSYKPICFYGDKIGKLPTLQLTVQSLQLSLPPTLYVAGYDDSDSYASGVITLNFRSLSSSLSDHSYVTSDYTNYVILDQNFMSYYYTQFSYASSNYQVQLYSQYYNPTQNAIWPFIVGGVLGFIIFVGIICCCVKRRNKRIRDRTARARLFENDSLVNNSNIPAQVTGLQEVQGANIPYPPQNYHNYNNNYNQGGYGYPSQIPSQPYPYSNNNFNNFNNPQSGAYNYIPPSQAQFNGETRGFGVPSQQ